jgi:hypothetical protein
MRLLQRHALTGQNDREAAALALGLVVGNLTAERPDQALHRLGLVGILEAHDR